MGINFRKTDFRETYCHVFWVFPKFRKFDSQKLIMQDFLNFAGKIFCFLFLLSWFLEKIVTQTAKIIRKDLSTAKHFNQSNCENFYS